MSGRSNESDHILDNVIENDEAIPMSSPFDDDEPSMLKETRKANDLQEQGNSFSRGKKLVKKVMSLMAPRPRPRIPRDSEESDVINDEMTRRNDLDGYDIGSVVDDDRNVLFTATEGISARKKKPHVNRMKGSPSIPIGARRIALHSNLKSGNSDVSFVRPRSGGTHRIINGESLQTSEVAHRLW